MIDNANTLPQPRKVQNRSHDVPGMYLLLPGATSCKPGYLIGDITGPIRAGVYKAVKDRCYSFTHANSNGG